MAAHEVRLAIVGVGSMGQAHVRGLAELPDARLVAICDRDAELARSVAGSSGAAVYTDGERMIAEAGIEALYICVPPYAHEDLEIHAAARGLHLFVEKPVSLYPDQAQRALAAIEKSGVMTQVGYQLRYLPHFRQLHAFLSDKEVGTAHVCRWSSLPDKDWWRRYDQGGGQLVEMTTHQVDLLRWILGEVESVSASYSFNRLLRDEPDLTIPDTQTVLLRFASGAAATVSTSCAVGRGGLNSMDFAIRDARVSVKGEEILITPAGTYPLSPLPTETLTADEAFVRAVATGDRSLLLSPYADGLQTAAVTLAANGSAEEGGRQVRLDEILQALAGKTDRRSER